MQVPDEQIIILTKGWDRRALEGILSDFERKYELDSSALKAAEASHGLFRIRLHQPLAAYKILFLVNYIHYPEGYDLRGRSPVVVALTRLNAAFGVTTPSMVGQLAAIYVPSNDSEYDEVYAKLDTEAAYRVSFTNMGWEETTDGRQSDEVSALLRSRTATEAATSL